MPERPGRNPPFCKPAYRWATADEARKTVNPATRGLGRPRRERPMSEKIPPRLRVALDMVGSGTAFCRKNPLD